MIASGHVTLKAFEDYIGWYEQLTYESAKDVFDVFGTWRKAALSSASEHDGIEKLLEPLQAAMENAFKVNWCSCDNMEDKFKPIHEQAASRLKSLLLFATEFNQTVNVRLWCEDTSSGTGYALLYIGNPNACVPVVGDLHKYLEYIPLTDYSDISLNQMRLSSGLISDDTLGQLVPQGTTSDLTVSDAESRLASHTKDLDALKQHIEEAQRCESPELIEMKNQIEALQQEMYAKKYELMEQLNEKLYEMEEMKFQLEGQIYLLDSQIYSILCYTGQTVNFTKIRSGKAAAKTEPIVIYQKLRFLDEELGRLASLYQIDWHEIHLFETFLQHHPLALDTFAPNERCVTLVRLSRTGMKVGMGADRFGAYNNIMDNYQYIHGTTVGIIIRNGENLYLGWTEEDRVDIKDDLILTSTVVDVQPAEEIKFTFESDKRRYIEKERKERKKILNGYVSRAFVYNILQGVVDNTDMLPLPDGVKLNKPSEYVVFALADKWLKDNRFGTLQDMVRKANEVILEGDVILTTQKIVPERRRDWNGGYLDQTWYNARGRGARNRTHDCQTEDCTLYRVNLVESTDGYRHVYVSVKKGELNWWTCEPTNARANFELEDREFINVSNLSSVQLEYAITNRHVVEGYSVHGAVADYAHMIRYLKTAIECVRDREQREKALIDAVDSTVCTDPEWVMKILEFKAEKHVRNFTATWAKRFVNWTKQSS